MRYIEIAPIKTDLFELKMSPSSLKKMTSDINALVGIEFELIMPEKDNDDYETEMDMAQDERAYSISDIIDFFSAEGGNSRSELRRLENKMREDYQEWLDSEIDSLWDDQKDDYVKNYMLYNFENDWTDEAYEEFKKKNPNLDEESEEFKEYAKKYISNKLDEEYFYYESDARKEWKSEIDLDNMDESMWLQSIGIRRMSDVDSQYSVEWPYWTENTNSDEYVDPAEYSASFKKGVGRQVKIGASYKDVPRTTDSYIIEPDSSLGKQGLEFISPPLPINEMLSDLDKVAKWALKNGITTDQRTGLHINVSVPGYNVDNLDYVKLALFLGDTYILEKFNRVGNTYARGMFEKVKNIAKTNPEKIESALRDIQQKLNIIASRVIHGASTDKYSSINVQNNRIEFRGPGNDWLSLYEKNPDEIKNTILRMVVALNVALNPEAYRQEYIKKLSKLYNPTQSDQTIDYFVKYVTGELPRSALTSFVRQTQKLRDIKREENNLLKTGNVDQIFNYIENTKKTIWPEAEPIILKKGTLDRIWYYLRYYKRSAWPEAEPILETDPTIWSIYLQHYKNQ